MIGGMSACLQIYCCYTLQYALCFAGHSKTTQCSPVNQVIIAILNNQFGCQFCKNHFNGVFSVHTGFQRYNIEATNFVCPSRALLRADIGQLQVNQRDGNYWSLINMRRSQVALLCSGALTLTVSLIALLLSFGQICFTSKVRNVRKYTTYLFSFNAHMIATNRYFLIAESSRRAFWLLPFCALCAPSSFSTPLSLLK